MLVAFITPFTGKNGPFDIDFKKISNEKLCDQKNVMENLNLQFEGLIRNEDIDSELNGGYGYSPILSINKTMSGTALREYIKTNYKKAVEISIDKIIEAEMAHEEFEDYLDDIFGLKKDEIEDYKRFLKDGFLESYNENPEVIIKFSNEHYTKFVLY